MEKNKIKRFNDKSELNMNSKKYERCWVIRNNKGDIMWVVKSDEEREEIRKKGYYLDEYKLFDK